MSALPAAYADALSTLSAALDAQPDASLEQLMQQAQTELRRIAHRERLSFGSGETLSTTALVNEAYLKLAAGRLPEQLDRGLFFGCAARAMRQVLVDHARRRGADKRGAGRAHDTLSAAAGIASEQPEALDVVALDRALSLLEQASPRAAEVVQLRYFAGLSDVEIAQSLGIDERTVRRDWLKARGWLHAQLGESP